MIKADERRAKNLHPGYVNNEGANITNHGTGFAALDAVLPGAGWPPASLTEFHVEQEGIGELRLLMPFLAHLSQNNPPSWIAWIAPPYIPYAPALAAVGMNLRRQLLIQPSDEKDILWALEQSLTSGACSAVLAWPENIAYHHLRRLQLAAQNGHSYGFLFRATSAIKTPSPAALRLQLAQRQNQLTVNILKCRGAVSPYCLNVPIRLSTDHAMA